MKIRSLLIVLLSFSQLNAQLVINNGAKMVINGGTSSTPAYVVLDNPTATPISTNGATNGIISESEYNILQYNLKTGTTAITVPYMSSYLESFPLTLNVTAAGSGSGNIRFSTVVPPVRATGFNNFLYRPSDVTNMYGGSTIVNNSDKTIDRFWIIDATGYTTKPAVNLTFTYIDAEHAANGGNTITELNLRAQRFNPTTDSWEGYSSYLPTGTINTTTNTVSNVVATAGNFFRSWTLNDLTIPLPIELTRFDAYRISRNDVQVVWRTDTEINSDYFSVERSFDGHTWTEIGTVVGAGNSNYAIDYAFMDENAPNIQGYYYRLKQVDFNGNFNYYGPKYIGFSDDFDSELVVFPNPTNDFVQVIFSSNATEQYSIVLTDQAGKLISKQDILANSKTTQTQFDLSQLAAGVYTMYLFDIKGNKEVVKILRLP
ncbi:MAG TPA: T9SS type A sorting domain-containing protein [Taishania sp.]|nr:T9SS type A sorting domain-containing protein [Taishania sp.]